LAKPKIPYLCVPAPEKHRGSLRGDGLLEGTLANAQKFVTLSCPAGEDERGLDKGKKFVTLRSLKKRRGRRRGR